MFPSLSMSPNGCLKFTITSWNLRVVVEMSKLDSIKINNIDILTTKIAASACIEPEIILGTKSR